MYDSLHSMGCHMDARVCQGACGYGGLDKAQWPYWSVAALSVRNPFYVNGKTKGCGCAHSPCSSLRTTTTVEQLDRCD